LDDTEAGTVTVHGRAAGYAQQIAVGRHRLTGDEPHSAGGTDTGPSPFELLLAALGSCTSMTVALFARHKGWPLEAVTVRLRHSTINAVECQDCETKGGQIDEIHLDVELVGALSDEQRARLLAIADKCPIHRTLTSELHIQSRLTRGAGYPFSRSARGQVLRD
jgi:putative redox protein